MRVVALEAVHIASVGGTQAAADANSEKNCNGT